MNKKVFLSVLFSLLCFGAFAEHNLEPVPLVGCMNYSEAWSDNGTVSAYIGFYSFLSDGSQPFTSVSSVGKNEMCNLGGAYGDGVYVAYDVFGSYLSYYIKFHIYYPDDAWSGETISLPKNYQYVPRDLTYDYRTGKFYAVCAYSFENSDTGYLCEVDTETGYLTNIAKLNVGICNVAADADGLLWGIGNNGHLYQIALDGTLTDKGQTDYKPTSENQGATIDFRTGKYFWAANAYKLSTGSWDDTYTQLLAIDTNNAETSPQFTFARREQFSGLSVLNTHPDAPDLIDDLSFKPTAGASLTGIVTFTVPTLTYAQKPLEGDVTVKLMIDNKLVDTQVMAAGSTYSFEKTLTSGNHTAKVVCLKGDLESLPTSTTAFFGSDKPKAVANLVLTPGEDLESATLTWDAPVVGVNGGYLDPSSLTYTIRRMPDNITVSGITETAYTDLLDRSMCYTYYEVTCYAGSSASDKVKSAKTHLGTPISLPYANTFNSQAAFNEFITIDNNNDGIDGFESHAWNWDDDYGAAFYYGMYDVTADDYLITPSLSLEAGRQYVMQFQIYGYQGWDNHLEICAGSRPTVEKLNRVILDWTSNSTMSTPINKVVTFTAQEGERYIAFHNISDTGEHMSIDNVLIYDPNDTGIALPEVSSDDTIYDLTGRRVNNPQHGIYIINHKKVVVK